MSIRTEISDSLNNDTKNSCCDVYIEGLGTTTEENGAVAYVEFYEGKYWLRVWADINQEDPTHSIDLSAAHENNRIQDPAKPDKYMDQNGWGVWGR